MRVLVDGRIGWGQGIGRVIAETAPRVAALLPQVRFDLLVNHKDSNRAAAAVGALPNLTPRLTAVEPFSAAEQLALPRLAHDYDLTWFTNYWVPLRYPRPFVVTVHDILHLDRELFPTSSSKRALSRLTFHKARRDARLVMFDSRFTARSFVREIGSPRRSSVVHLGADHLPEVPSSALAAKERRVLVVAASKLHKNFAMALRAWKDARRSPDWRLTIVTPKDPMRSSVDVARYAAEIDGVEIVRGISDGELADLYVRSAVVLMPSRYEGFGLPLLEGLRAGAWCISSTAPALVEIADGAFVQFVDGTDQEGWTAALEWACERWECEPDLLQPLLAHNIAAVRNYSWSRTAERIAQVLSDSLALTT